MKKLSDVSEEDKIEEPEVENESLNGEDDYHEDEDSDIMNKGHRTQAARKMLSIPCEFTKYLFYHYHYGPKPSRV